MMRPHPRRALVGLTALAVGIGGALAGPALTHPAQAADGPTISDPGFELRSWRDTLHYHAAFVSPGADGTGSAVRIGMDYPEGSKVPYDGTMPVKDQMPSRGMVNKIVSGVEPNTTYALSVKVKGPNVQVGLYDAEYQPYYQGYAPGGNGNGRYSAADWTTASARITTGPRTTELHAFCLTYENQGPNYCDDFSVVKVGPAAEPQPAPATWDDPTTPPLGPNGFPVTIPAVQQFTPDGEAAWDGRDGIRRIVVDKSARGQLAPEADRLAELFGERFGWRVHVVPGKAKQAKAGDLFLALGQVPVPQDNAKARALTHEAYRLDIGPRSLALTAGGPAGALYGGMTLLQALTGRDELPAGTVVDYTDQKYRGLQVDSARRYYSIDWIKNHIDDLAYTKMNYLILRVKDSQGLRVESDVAPELVDHLPDGGSWSKAEVADLVAYARERHVTIVPEVDMPGHALMDSVLYPDLMFTNGSHEMQMGYDYARPEVRDFLARLAIEIGETFDSPFVHLGGDEYGASTDKHFVDWIRAETGNPAATSDDGYGFLFNEIHAKLKAQGRGAWMFNDMITAASKVTPVDRDITIIYWARIYSSMTAQGMLDAGYELVGSSSDLYHDLWPPNSEGARNNSINWPLPSYQWSTYASPYVYSGGFGPPREVSAESKSSGQFFPIWDDAMGWAPEYVLTQTLLPRLRLFAQTMWHSPRPVETLAEYDPYVRFLGHAPGFEQPTTTVGTYTMTLDADGAARAGGKLAVEAGGFLPGETVEFSLTDWALADGTATTPWGFDELREQRAEATRAIGTLRADDEGRIAGTLRLPKDATGEWQVGARAETSHRPAADVDRLTIAPKKG